MSARTFTYISIIASLALSTSAFAADVNSYRNGGAYLSSPAIAPAMCESQCAGDAQCRSWNFLRSGNPNMVGMCELNSHIGTTAPHPFAISGSSNKSQTYGANLVQGRTNVTRIGDPVTVVPQSQVRARTLTASTRPTARQVPHQNSGIPATITRQRSFTPSPQTRRQPVAPQSPSAVPPTLGSALPFVRPASIAPSSAATSVYPVQRQAAPNQPSPQPAALQTASIPAAATSLMEQQIRLGAKADQVAAQAISQPHSSAQASTQTPQQPPAVMPMQNSALFGSLYDDVATPRPAVKQPLYSELTPHSADTPIATAPRAAPVAPVLEMPTGLTLAGNAPQ